MCEWSGMTMAGKVCEWCEVAKCERWDISEVARSERWERNEVAIWGKWKGSEQRRWDGIQGQIVLYCSREAKCKQRFTAGIS